MGFIDFILNLAGLLLWLNWRSRHFEPLQQSRPVTVIRTLKRTDSRHLKSWHLAVALVCLLGGRGLFYWFIGGPVNWTPKLTMGLISLAFRSDLLRLAVLYSILSFARLLLVFYFWLLFLVAINRRVTESDPVQKLGRLHLGRTARWPWVAQLLLLPCFVAGIWLMLSPMLAHLGVLSSVHSIIRVTSQGLLVAAGLPLSLKYLLPPILLLHLINSYVFLGNNSFWDFITTTSQNLLSPLRHVPLRLARLDFTPIAGMLLVVFALEWLPNYLVGKLAEWKVSFWPQ